MFFISFFNKLKWTVNSLTTGNARNHDQLLVSIVAAYGLVPKDQDYVLIPHRLCELGYNNQNNLQNHAIPCCNFRIKGSVVKQSSWQAFLHTMDLLWEKFQWILPLYMKPISFQSKASVVCSVTAAIFTDFGLKKLNVFSKHIGQKTINIWIPQNKSPGIEMLINFLC